MRVAVADVGGRQAGDLPPELPLEGAEEAWLVAPQIAAAGVGVIIDSQAEVGGWPDLEPGTPWIDTDGDGMPDDWETARGLDPADPADGSADRDGDGHTHLEDWLNSL